MIPTLNIFYYIFFSIVKELMRIINLNNIQKILYFFILIFPLIIILKSAAINITLFLISFISVFLVIKKKTYFFFKDYFVLFIIFFFFFIFINTILNFYNLENVIKSLGIYRYLFLSFAVFLTLENISKKHFSLFIYLNCILLILVGLDIFYQYNFNKNIFGFLPGMCESNFSNCIRFSGVFGSELIAGSYISQIGLLFFFLIKHENFQKNSNYQNIIIIFLFFIFLTVLLTGERNALLIFLICIFLFYFFCKKIINFLIICFISLVILLLIAQNSHSIKSRYLNFLDVSVSTKDSSFKEKITTVPWYYHYKAATELFIKKPLIGHGYKSFRLKCSQTKIDKKLIENPKEYKGYRGCSTHPHNYMMEFLSENGLIGFIFFIFFIIIILFKILEVTKYHKNKYNYLLIGIGSLMLAILFPLKPSGSFFTTFNASILFYLLGFFLYYAKKKNFKKKSY